MGYTESLSQNDTGCEENQALALTEVVYISDEPWEEIEALPSISSLKSRFEGDSQKSGQVNGPVSTQQVRKYSDSTLLA